MYPVIYCRATASNQVLDLLGILMGLLGMFNGFAGFFFFFFLICNLGFWFLLDFGGHGGGDWVVWLLRE